MKDLVLRGCASEFGRFKSKRVKRGTDHVGFGDGSVDADCDEYGCSSPCRVCSRPPSSRALHLLVCTCTRFNGETESECRVNLLPPRLHLILSDSGLETPAIEAGMPALV